MSESLSLKNHSFVILYFLFFFFCIMLKKIFRNEVFMNFNFFFIIMSGPSDCYHLHFIATSNYFIFPYFFSILVYSIIICPFPPPSMLFYHTRCSYLLFGTDTHRAERWSYYLSFIMILIMVHYHSYLTSFHVMLSLLFSFF